LRALGNGQSYVESREAATEINIRAEYPGSQSPLRGSITLDGSLPKARKVSPWA